MARSRASLRLDQLDGLGDLARHALGQLPGQHLVRRAQLGRLRARPGQRLRLLRGRRLDLCAFRILGFRVKDSRAGPGQRLRLLRRRRLGLCI